jgi:hypothetical protein
MWSPPTAHRDRRWPRHRPGHVHRRVDAGRQARHPSPCLRARLAGTAHGRPNRQRRRRARRAHLVPDRHHRSWRIGDRRGRQDRRRHHPGRHHPQDHPAAAAHQRRPGTARGDLAAHPADRRPGAGRLHPDRAHPPRPWLGRCGLVRRGSRRRAGPGDAAGHPGRRPRPRPVRPRPPAHRRHPAQRRAGPGRHGRAVHRQNRHPNRGPAAAGPMAGTRRQPMRERSRLRPAQRDLHRRTAHLPRRRDPGRPPAA